MGLARLLLPKRGLLRVRTLLRLLVLLRRSAGLLPLRGTVQHRLADGSGELRGGVLPLPHRLESNNNSLAVALGYAVTASRGGCRGCGRDDFVVTRWLMHRKKVALWVAHDVKGDAQAMRKVFGVVAG